MKRFAALTLSTLALAGCATPAQDAVKFEQQFERRVQTYGASCEKIGFTRDTDPWRNCVLTATPYGHTGHH